MMKHWYFMILAVALASCKSKAVLAEANTKPIIVADDNAITAKKLIDRHYNNKIEFSTLYIRASAKYKDEHQSQNVSAEIKIRKDEKILVSIRFLGITMAKALITPSEVKYYEKINGTYFEGDYASLSNWLGTDLDFLKIQNMLIGKPIDDLTRQDYAFELTEKFYKLSKVQDRTEKSFLFEPQKYLLKRQEVIQPEKERQFSVSYPGFQDLPAAVLPSELEISALQKKGRTEISIDYNSVTFNEELTFPYSVPEGYDRIYIN